MSQKLIVKQVAFYSSITSANLGGWRVLVCADSADAGGVGVQNYENMLKKYLNAS